LIFILGDAHKSNPVRLINAFVDSLDLDLIELGFKHAELSPTGRTPYDPADLIKLYILRWEILGIPCVHKPIYFKKSPLKALKI